MDSNQKTIFLAVLFYVVVWNSSYFWENLPGLFDLAILLSLFIFLCILALLGLFQVIKYLNESPKNHMRIINVLLISFVIAGSYLKPFGIIDFEKFESDNILHARYKGAGNCGTSIQLKQNKRFKNSSICFGVDHYWGGYEIVGDTIKLQYDDRNRENDFLILKLDQDSHLKQYGMLYYHSSNVDKRALPLRVEFLDKEYFE